ncbi:MAG: MOSC domain-containing protein [Saprospiraceae bacterium]
MQLLSLNVGQPRSVEWQGHTVQTSIFKTPVADRRKVSLLHIEGDAQADLRVHGGKDKAVYAYDSSYYERWKTVLDRINWSPGLFGENLTTEGLPDDKVYVGNIYRCGTTLLQAVQPRFPCFKLNIKFGLPDMIQRFYAQQMHGTYFRVLEAGDLQVGDPIQLIEVSAFSVTIKDVVTAFTTQGADPEMLQQILHIPYLPESLRPTFQKFRVKHT